MSGCVERGDDADDAGRHAPRQADPGLFAGQQLPIGMGRERCCFVAFLRRDMGIEPRHRRDASGLPDEPPLDLFGVLLEQLPGAPQDGGPFQEAGSRPVRLRLGRVGAGLLDVHVVGDACRA